MSTVVNNSDINVNTSTFSAGEVHVQLEGLSKQQPESLQLKACIRSSDDLMELMLVHNALINHYGQQLVIDLEIPYFPYARQDRVCAVGQAFSLQVIATMLNSLKVNSLTTWDAHSPVTKKLTRAINISQEEIIASNQNLVSQLKDRNTILVCPDKGAIDKCQAVKDKFSVSKIIHSVKTRNPKTGAIIDTQIKASDLSGKTAVIIDDICDGGRTFIEIAKKLKEKNVERVVLYVTHGIFSKGLEVFDGLIDEIYTSNSFPQKKNPKLNVIDFSATANRRSAK